MKQTPLGLTIDNAGLRYPNVNQAILDKLSMQIPAGQWTCLLGRSGSGKTSLLRYLAGLLDSNVEWQGNVICSDGLALQQRIAYMAQQDLLLPWLSVVDNVCLSYRFNKQKITPEVTEKALALLDQVGLLAVRHALPQTLSGGMRQRVALARTLMQDKPFILMDEPFSALDAVTRHKLQQLSYTLLKDKTVILITHDPQEAVRLAGRLYILTGRPAQAEHIALPISRPPRDIDADSALVQQRIFHLLEQDYA
ncbi:ABC transporter ATP-binding protein [Marinomonas pollencensis]|uniref:Putative hydroxymethylpyrimidine transport system ATP-binding protein n=1 Tax=Marinomonas pollencensis TaxID=491954 RepID=A0A3E0DTE4_9GAMM|nr:ABC transporter ATP-binding protein [Marinomonas pollencensis]REG86839.1 putative hydroxymethylpyrimidine transport system ATP-binding protein [Marinomonas pollencensis]